MRHIYIPLTLIFTIITIPLCAQDFDYSPVGKGCEIENYLEFTICYSEQHEQPWWVSYYLTSDELSAPTRYSPSRFTTDENISTGSATHNDFTYSGYDRGHMSRAEYNKKSQKAYEESFYMSNVSPQIGLNFNRVGGDWYNLEELEKDFANELGSIYSATGALFENSLEVIGDDVAITVPGYFFKAILSPNKSKAIAFIIKHDNIDDDLWDSAVSIDELEGRTGMNFFGKLNNRLETEIESNVDIRYWKELVEN